MDQHQEHQIKTLGHVVKLSPPLENEATSGHINVPLEVVGFLPVIIDGIKYKIPLYND